jgi:hypothetical protein
MVFLWGTVRLKYRKSELTTGAIKSYFIMICRKEEGLWQPRQRIFTASTNMETWKWTNKIAPTLFRNIQKLGLKCARRSTIVLCSDFLYFNLTVPHRNTMVKPLIHQSELRTYTKVVPFKENSSFRFVVLWQILNGME